MKALIGDRVIAEAPEAELVKIEGNWYFPPASVVPGVLVDSSTPYICVWKGECRYFSLNDGETVLKDQAWSYPAPLPSAIDRVGKNFAHYVTFGNAVHTAH